MKILKNQKHSFKPFRKLLLCFALISLLPFESSIASEVKTISQVVPIIFDSAPMYSESAASKDGSTLGIVYTIKRSSGYSDLFGVFSKDAGKNWSPPHLFSTMTPSFGYGIVVNDSTYEITVVWSDTSTNTQHKLYISKSSDGGNFWRNLGEISSSTTFGTIDVISLKQNANGTGTIIGLKSKYRNQSRLIIATSGDSGQSWKIRQSPNVELLGFESDLGVSSDGQLFAYVYEETLNNSTKGKVYFSISSDRGESWSSEKVLANGFTSFFSNQIVALEKNNISIILGNVSQYQVSNNLGVSFATKNLPFFGAWNSKPLVGIDGSSIFALASTNNWASKGGGKFINFSKTSDAGFKWSPVKVLSSTGHNYPKIVGSAQLQLLGVLWAEVGGGLNYALSNDGGLNWSKPINILKPANNVIWTAENDILASFNEKEMTFSVAWVNLDSKKDSALVIDTRRIFTVQYDQNDSAILTRPNSAIYTAGDVVEVPVFYSDNVKPHFKFLGWNTKADGTGSLFSGVLNSFVIEKDTKLFAQWEELNKFEISYDSNGVLSKTFKSRFFYADEYPLISNVSKSDLKVGKEFLSWNTLPNGKGQNFYSGISQKHLTGPLKLYAIAKNASDLKSIICVKGTLKKKVTALNPVCPAGYKRK
jgi:hypothetical protein